MGMYTVTIGGSQVQWTPQQVQNKLEQLSQLKDKKVEWLQGNLSVYHAPALIRIIWCIIRTILPCIAALVRPYLLGIDLNQSQTILNQLRPQLGEDVGLFNQAAGVFNGIAPHHQVNLISELVPDAVVIPDQPKLVSVQTLIEHYEKCWILQKACFEDVPFEMHSMVSRLTAFNAQFPQICPDYAANFGYIQKIDVPAGSCLYLRADLHGDLRSLLSNLWALKGKGLLDEHFKCAPRVYLIFDGDYADRGTNSMQVLEVLAALKMENPGVVFLIRGNHETLWVNDRFSENDPDFSSFLGEPWNPDQDAQNRRKLLEGFYERMPLTLYVGQEGPERQYIQVTHGMFEPTVDPATLLDAPQSSATMVVPKQRVLSDRIKAVQFDAYCDYLSLIAECQDRAQRRVLKQAYAAQRITILVGKDIRGYSDEWLTAYNWGDMSCLEGEGPPYKLKTTAGSFGNRTWGINVRDVQCCLRLSSTIHRVKMVFRGHEHELAYYTLPSRKGGDKLVVMTLPVGMDSAGYKDRYPVQLDRAYIFEVQPKVRNWKKTPLLRVSRVKDNTFGDSSTIYETDSKQQV